MNTSIFVAVAIGATAYIITGIANAFITRHLRATNSPQEARLIATLRRWCWLPLVGTVSVLTEMAVDRMWKYRYEPMFSQVRAKAANPDEL